MDKFFERWKELDNKLHLESYTGIYNRCEITIESDVYGPYYRVGLYNFRNNETIHFTAKEEEELYRKLDAYFTENWIDEALKKEPLLNRDDVGIIEAMVNSMGIEK